MPNNFKLTGDYYVSKAGNDANAGTSPDAPKRTLTAVNALATTSGKTIVVGAGVYVENIQNLGTQTPKIWKADGIVVIDGLQNAYTFGPAAGGSTFYYGFIFRNIQVGFATNAHNFNDCTFINCSSIFGNGLPFTRCIIINCPNIYSTFSYSSFTSCIIINSSITISSDSLRIVTLINSYVLNSLISLASVTSPSTFNYNNIQNTRIIMNAASSVTTGVYQDFYGRYYDLSTASFSGDGTIGLPYGRPYTNGAPFSFSSHRSIYPTFNPSSSAVDPKFNSIEDQDFTLQADSWHIGRASDGTNIGGTKYATRRPANVSFSGSQATVDPSLVFQYNNYVISGSQVTGSITSAPMAVNTAAPKVIQKVTYNGLLAFNKDTGSASGSNQNVPDFDTFTSASLNAAANPDRLVYYMRHTTGSSIPVSDSGWDNGGLWTAGQYNVFEWNTKPSIDNLGVGNGSGSFNAAASPTFIQATYVQMQIKLRNDYLF